MKKLILLPLSIMHFTRRKRIIAISFLLVSCGCTKDPVEHKTDNIRQEFTIVEAKSNIPLKGVTVTAYSCTGSFCTGPGALLGTTITNDSGKVVFNTPGVGWLKFSKERYWPGEAGGLYTNTYELTPIATLKVSLKKTNPNSYPNGYLLSLWYPNACLNTNIFKQLDQPANGVIYLKGAGNCENSIAWAIDNTLPPNFTQSI